MKYRKLGWTDLVFSTIGLGTWAMGGKDWAFGWGPQDDQDSIATIHKAFELGINWIDTAAVYGLGHSEIIVGKAIKGMHEKPLIATKCSRVWDENKTLGDNQKKASIRKECENSLRQLQIERIDLYQIHWPRPAEDLEEGWYTMQELVKEGKVRYAGVCNYNKEQLELILKIALPASLQPPYSMIVPGIEEEILPWCGTNKIGILAYSPMYKGLLTGSFSKERILNLPETDHRTRDPRFQEPELSINLKMVESLKKIASRNNMTPLQLAIAWTCRKQELTSAIAGARNPEQLLEIANAGDCMLSPEDEINIAQILSERLNALAG